MSSSGASPFRWRSIILPALVPTLLFSIGVGAIIPIIPIFAGDLGATLAVAGLVSGILMIGELVGDIPSGWLVSMVGERSSMIGASLLSVIGLILCLIAPNPFALGVGIFLVGLANAVFLLARHAFMTSFVRFSHRARALSSLGGISRFGYFLGPFITVGAIQVFGTVSSAFWIHIVACLGAAVILVVARDPSDAFNISKSVRSADGQLLREGEALVEQESHGMFRTILANRGVLTKLGAAGALIGAMRASRVVILPLWGVSIGVSDTNIAIIVGIAGGVDFALFYVSGQIMDHWGRLWSALPCMIGMGVGHVALSLTYDLPSKVEWYIAMAMILSLANGIGSGILMTLGSDLADKRNPAPFLGAWRFTGGIGKAGAPLVIAGLTAAASLPLAAATLGVLAFAGAGLLVRYVPRYIPHAPRKPRL